MTDDTRQIDDIFCAAIEIELPDERNRYVESACGGNQELLARVQSLLASHDHAEGFLEAPAPGLAGLSQRIAADRAFDLAAGSTIGGYKIVKQIGEGGIGTVFLAEQSEPVRRSVALKVIKLGMDTQQVIQRFNAERQALALMDHPNIARVYDAGSTALGRPYFVMELVDGVAISEYCDSNRLDIRQRLKLFVQVCQAVHHAHQKGLIHRDIKPGNVLVSTVDDQPVAKVIDFGIAKATGVQGREKTLFTQFNQLIGTIEYMSPEQAEGSLDIDIRTDVYSLGVVLYELLTGRTPFEGTDLRSKAYGEMQRIIRETEPPKPSTRVRTVASSQLPVASKKKQTKSALATDNWQLATLLRGELDWIVMKCIEKDRARRYESAASLAADVFHFLADEPVSAAAPSRIYRTRKFVRRHRGPVIASTAVVVALVAGMIGTTIGLLRASARERETQEQIAIANAVSRFQTNMLGSADPEKLLGDKVTVVDAITAAVKELDAGALRDQPLVEASVRDMIGMTLHSLGRFDAAEGNVRRGLELRRAITGASSVAAQASKVSLGAILYSKGQPSESERELREALQLARSAGPGFPGLQLAKTLDNLGITLRAQGRFAEAEQLARESNEIYQHDPAADDRQRAMGIGNVAQALFDQNKLDEAEPLYRACLALQRQALPPNHPQTLATLTNLSWLYFAQRKLDDATKLAREALEGTRKAYPVDHPAIASTLLSLGTILFQADHDAEAEVCLRDALAIQRRALPANHPDIAATLNNLAAVLQFKDDFKAAETAYRECLQIAQSSLPEDHPDLSLAKFNLAMSLNNQKKFADAEPLLRDGLAVDAKAQRQATSNFAGALLLLGESLVGQQRYAEAEQMLKDAAHRLADTNSPSWRLEKCQTLLAEARQHLPPSPATSPSSATAPSAQRAEIPLTR
jgi:serine/threonine protein kinase/tetratricopeptide (TPR) repeat protein